MAYWIILNGAPKCGSTWLTQLVKAGQVGQALPAEFQREGWSSSSVSTDKVDSVLDFLRSSGKENAYYTKQHWPNPERDEVNRALQFELTVVCNIYRDVRDMIVSRYFHDKRLGKTSLDIQAYVDSNLQSLLTSNYKYHHKWLTWAENGDNRNRYVLTSYEALSNELPKYGALFLESVFAGIKMKADHDALIKAATRTNFSRKKNTGEGKFFRKGVAFGWKEYLTDRQSEAVSRICDELDYPGLKARMASLAPHLSVHLKIADAV